MDPKLIDFPVGSTVEIPVRVVGAHLLPNDRKTYDVQVPWLGRQIDHVTLPDAQLGATVKAKGLVTGLATRHTEKVYEVQLFGAVYPFSYKTLIGG